MKLFDGKLHAQTIEKDISDIIAKKGDILELAIVQIDEKPESHRYVNLKVKLCEKLGIPVKVYNFDSVLGKEEVKQRVKEVFKNAKVGGGIIQLPLPNPEWENILDSIPIEKDLDLLSPVSQSKFYSENFSALPPVVRAVKFFIEVNKIDPKSLKVCVLGSGFLVGRPVAYYLQKLGTEVETILDYEKDRKLPCQLAILSAGIPNLVNGADLPENCHVIDFGSSIVEGKTVGDLDMSSQTDHLGVVSASPGGMGPLVVRFLVKNFAERGLGSAS